ncbi:MAG: PilZ domain-containing protein [Pirellulales bacterium]
MPEYPDSEVKYRDPRTELADEKKVLVRVAYQTKDGPELLDGQLLDISRSGAKLAIPRGLPFGEKVDLHAVIPELDLDLTVGAVVSWNRQDTDGRWLIGCRFDPGLSDATIDRMAHGGYLERRHSPRYPISLKATASFELSEHDFSVWIQDFSTDGFSILSPRPGEVDQRLRLEIVKENGERIVISARTRWCVSVDDDYLVGCAFVNGHDFQHLWELTYKTNPNQPLLPRVSLPQPRWMLAWFAALMAFMVAYPVVIWHVSALRSLPLAQAADAGVSHREPAERGEDVPPPTAKPSAVTRASTLQPTSADSKWLEQQRLELDRRANQLQQQVEQLAEQATVLDERRALWGKEEKEHQARLAADQRQVETTRLALQADRQAFEAQQTASKRTQREWVTAKKKWETERQVSLRARQAWEQQRRKFVAEREVWERRQRELLVAGDGRRSPAPRKDAIGKQNAKAADVAQRGDPNRSTKPSEEGAGRDAEAVAVRGPAEVANRVDTDRRRGQTAFHRGRDLLIERRYDQAARSLTRAIEFDAGRPFYYYLLALAQYQLNDTERAVRSVAQAARLEQTHPIQRWGHRMERLQGAARLWLEQARAKAKRDQPLSAIRSDSLLPHVSRQYRNSSERMSNRVPATAGLPLKMLSSNGPLWASNSNSGRAARTYVPLSRVT